MVDGVEELGFWLPAEFLDEIYTDAPEVKNNHRDALFDSELCFPKGFPFENSTGDEIWVAPTSPQSTLSRMSSFSGNGSPNSVTSPPAPPLSLAVEDLIHRAVGQVEMLKLGCGGGFDLSVPSYPKPRRVAPPINLQQVQGERIRRYGHQHQQVSNHVSWANPIRLTGPDLSGSANNCVGKRPCAGTGVFLPRRYDNDEKTYNNNVGSYAAADPRHKTCYALPPLVPSDPATRTPPSKGHVGSIKPQPRVSGAHNSNYDIFMARRIALLLRLQQQQQQRRDMLIEAEASRGVCLPQEWTY